MVKREKVNVGTPIYAMGFATKNRLLIGGGGGSSRSGVQNTVVGLDQSLLIAGPLLTWDYWRGNSPCTSWIRGLSRLSWRSPTSFQLAATLS
jgi:hypothetical protein